MKKKKHVSKETPSITEERVQQLRDCFPEAFTEGKPDFDKLRTALGDIVEERRQRYSFSWAGKTEAIRLLQLPSRATLIPAKDESVDFDKTKNIFIEGDNLEVLKLLYKSYFGRVKMIYIDPPYNIGKDLIYLDDYSDPLESYLKLTNQKDAQGNLLTSNPETSGRFHSAWLSMMYPRVFISRQLLREDGIFMVSIDDNEHANLRILLNEIFGEENLISEIVWNLGTGTEAGHFTRSHEYILVYAKHKPSIPYFSTLDDSPIKHGALKKITKANPPSDIKFPPGLGFEGENETFIGELGDSEKQIIVSGKMVFEKGKLKHSVTLRAGWAMRDQIISWLEGKETFDSKGQKVKRFYFNSQGILWYEKERETRHPKTVLTDIAKTKDGSKEVESLFGKKVMDFPKPTSLLKYLVALNTTESDIVLDYFAGSCPTAHAVIELNEVDDNNRRFIMIQIPEPVDSSKESGQNALSLGLKTISDIGKERITRVVRNIKKDMESGLSLMKRKSPQDLGFKVFNLAKSNYKPWSGAEAKEPEAYAKQMAVFTDPLVEGWRSENVIWEVAIKEGYGLDSRVEPVSAIKDNKVYLVTDSEKGQSFRICLDDAIKKATLKVLALKKDDLFICRDKALNDELAANLALQCRLKTI